MELKHIDENWIWELILKPLWLILMPSGNVLDIIHIYMLGYTTESLGTDYNNLSGYSDDVW